MPFDGSGTYNRNFPPGGWQGDSAANIKIKSDRHDQHDNDIALALSNMICKDGQSAPSANIPFNNKKITNLAAPTAATDAATKGYVDGIRTFPSAITISGSYPESIIKFSGATGPWGLSFVTPALSFGATPAGTFQWSDNINIGGNAVMALSKVGALYLYNRDDTAGSGPTVLLVRESASPAAGDLGGYVAFQSKNSGGTLKTMADVYATMNDVTAGSEDSSLVFRTMTAGVVTSALTLGATNVTVHSTLNTTGALSVTGMITASSNVIAGSGYFMGSSATAILGVASPGPGTVYLRPSYNSSTNQTIIDTGGNMTVGGNLAAVTGVFSGNLSATGGITSGGQVVANGGAFIGIAGQTILGSPNAVNGAIYLRPNGYASGTNQTFINTDGSMLVNGNFTSAGSISITAGGILNSTVTNLVISNSGGTATNTIYIRPNGSGSAVGDHVLDGSTHAFNGRVAVNGGSTPGYRIKAGTGGALGGNTFNINYGSGAQLWIDATNMGTFAYTSDYRIKKDVAPLPSMWDKVKALRTVSYTHKEYIPEPPAGARANKEGGNNSFALEDEDGMETIVEINPLSVDGDAEIWGFIAHEVQEDLLPTAAEGIKDEVGRIQSLNLPAILAAVTRALQEAMARIEALEGTPA